MGNAVLADRTILIVEDERLISLDVEKRLEAAGAKVLTATRLEQALRLAEHPDLSAGVLDFQLKRHDSLADLQAAR